jgi:dCMP deaminase
MKKEREIIAVVGMCGSGKSIVSDFLVKKGYKFLRFGQITLDEVKRRGFSSNERYDVEKYEKHIREGFRQKYGMAAFAILNKKKIDELLKKGNVVIDGLYSWSEYKFLKKTYGEMLRVIAVIANPEKRYSRLDQREKIDEKMRFRPMTKEQAMSRDYAEIENIEKAGPIAMADIIIENNGNKDELVDKLRKIFSDNPNRRPNWDEYFMEIVKSVSSRATCDRGRTACVIVKDKRILCTGYVGSPIGLPHCDEAGHLYETRYDANGKKTEHCIRTIHAEQNAIAQAARYGIPIDGATIYMKLEPCFWCVKQMINAGIKRVVCLKRYHGAELSRKALKEAGVRLDVLSEELEMYDKM